MDTKQPPRRHGSGAKAIALDENVQLARYRLYLLASALFSGMLALTLHFILGH